MVDTENSLGKSAETPPNPVKERLNHAYRIGLGLILADLRFAFVALVALAAAPIAYVLIQSSGQESATLSLLSALTQSLVIYLVTVRWYRFLGSSVAKVSRSIFRTVGFGLALWLILHGPLLIIAATRVPDHWSAMLLLLLVPAVYFNLKYFFYHLPLAVNWRGSLRQTFFFAAQLTRENLLLPVRVLIGPTAIVSLLSALVRTASPDGRELWVATATAGIEQLLWLFVPYLSCAYGTFLIPEQDWRDLGLDPYRSARVTTLTVQGPEFVARILRPRNALIVLIISLFIWLGNLVRLAELPPAVSITVVQIAVSDHRAVIDLALRDPEYRFRGFSPQLFQLGGDQGTPITTAPPSAEFTLQPGAPVGTATLQFTTDKTEAEIRKLKDLHLWYLGTRLTLLDTAAADHLEPADADG